MEREREREREREIERGGGIRGLRIDVDCNLLLFVKFDSSTFRVWLDHKRVLKVV